MQKRINAAVLKRMFVSGSALVEQNRELIDSLNVFPVPDGDTGTNMSLTLKAAISELSALGQLSVDGVSSAMSRGALKGARGNSGVITSQILRGFCGVTKDAKVLDTKTFANALKAGSDVAYKAVSKPKDGTILTVIRVISEQARLIAKKTQDLEVFFNEIIAVGEDILSKTTDMLEVLKRAGVVDAGGKGLVSFIIGMRMGLLGEEVISADGANVKKAEEENKDGKKGPEIEAFGQPDLTALDEIEFAYCTEFFITNIKKRTTHANIEKLRERLIELGDCVLVIGDLELIKVHVHSNRPDLVLRYALELGELDRIKIENMLEQNRQLRAKYEAQKKEQGLLVISAGAGLTEIFKELTVDVVLEGGQTMNPSANDIAEAVKKVNADHVFVFPNNKNIILAAEQAKALVKKKRIHVIPTKSIPQGISAILSFNSESTVEENTVNMSSAFDSIRSGQVTHAVRDSQTGKLSIKEGDFIGLDNKNILSCSKTLDGCLIDLVDRLKSNSSRIISLYYGEDVTAEDAEKLRDAVASKYPECEVDLFNGGQPVYYYIISIE